MAKIYNLAGDDEIITFNIGDFSLDVSLMRKTDLMSKKWLKRLKRQKN